MKKNRLTCWTAIALCFSLILGALPFGSKPVTAAEMPASQLLNPNFDLEPVDDQIPGWSVDPATADYGTIELSSEIKRNGNYSMLFWDKTSGTSPAGSFRVLSNPIAVSEGDTVTASAYVYRSAKGDQTHGIQPVIHYYTAAGKDVQPIEFVQYGEKDVPIGAWHPISITRTVPDNVAYIKVGLYSGFPSLTKLYVDEFSVNIDSPAPPEEIPTELSNPSFDLPLDNGSIPGWTLGSGTNGQFELSTEVYRSAPQSLYFKDSSDKDGLRVISDKFAVKEGYSLYSSAYVYVIEQSHNIVGEVYYYSSQGTQLDAKTDSFGAVTLGNKVWTEMSMFSTVPAGAAYAKIALYSGGVSNTEAYFDDLSFTLLPPEEPLDRNYGAPVDLGPMVKVNLGQAGAVQTNAEGENEVYFVTNGLPGTFYVLDGETGVMKFKEDIPNTEATWAMTVGSDKNVYFAGTGDGKLYRYLPAEKRVESLGYNTADNWVWDIEEIDGKIYGGTYNSKTHGKLFEYDIASQKFRSYGTVQLGQQYVRGIAVDEQYIYAGLGTTVQLFKVDRVTGEKTEIQIPGHSGETNSIADVFKVGNKLFVSVSTINMVVLDLDTNTIDSEFQYSNMISEPYPEDPNLIYYKYLTKLYKYDIAAKKSTEIQLSIPLPDTTRVKDLSWITPKSGEKAGKLVLAMVTQYGEYMLYDPVDNWVSLIELEIDPQPVRIQGVETGIDGRMYMGGYQRGMSIYNPFTNQIDVNISSFAQPEGIGFLNDKVYYGTYVAAVMYSFDPKKPVELNKNPELEYQISHQDRPFAITSGDNKLFVGTVPDYGVLGGALAIYDEQTDTWSQYNQVVNNQSIIGLAYKDGLLYGGTSVWGGLGIDPSEPEAKLFVWDVEGERKIKELTLNIPGIDKTPKMIGELSFGPDGLLWGAVEGTIFAMDVSTMEIVKSKVIRPSTYNTSKWMPYHLRWAPDGMLYTTLSRKIIAIEPETLKYKVIVDNFLNSMTIGIDGSIYYAPDAGVSLSKIAIPQTDATLSSITVDGETMTGFSPGILNYELKTLGPVVIEASSVQEGSTVSIDDRREAEGVIRIHVTAPDGKSSLKYQINWREATELELAIDQAIAAIDALPAAIKLSDKAAVAAARAKVTEAIELGALEEDIANLNVLAAAEAKIAALEAASIGGPPIVIDTSGINVNGEQLVISSKALQQASGDQAVLIAVPESVNQIILPVNAAEVLGSKHLQLQREDFMLDIPSSVLEQLLQQADSTKLADSLIELNIAKLTGDAAAKLMEQLARFSSASLAGSIYDFSLTWVAKDGNSISLAQFKEPLAIHVKLDSSLNPKRAGAYYIKDNGSLEFIGGTVQNGVLSASIYHFSKYAFLEYNKFFTDVAESHWAKEAIELLAAKHMITGTSLSTFSPERSITRAEFTSLIVRALKLEERTELAFTDISKDDWYAEAVAKAVAAGLVKGKSEAKFDPNGSIKREEMVVILMRAYAINFGGELDGSKLTAFSDEAEISEWALDYVRAATTLKLINGRTEHKFVPHGITTRAEAAALLQRIFVP
ncbi:S-layer homology domain-containing protein [Paenibacillus sp. GXUN7292]|uniref:S-layer homology domain-containing protein n=1 Tax=Paenibacillus sp. GXUN7292 TaxID=3422499 RepID=UPI003D7D4311